MTWYTLFVLLNKLNKRFTINVEGLNLTYQNDKVDEIMISGVSNLGIFSKPDTTMGLDFDVAEKMFQQKISKNRYHQIVYLIFDNEYTWI